MNGEKRLLRTIERANQRVRRYLAAQLGDLDITEIEAHLIARLSVRGPCTVFEVQQAFGLRRSTLSNALDRLEHKGLLTRGVHRADRRTSLLELTASGLETAARVRGVVDDLERHVRADVSAEQLAAFYAVMAALEGRLP
jgi:DNA-binding MarR family transcriptional regulator